MADQPTAYPNVTDHTIPSAASALSGPSTDNELATTTLGAPQINRLGQLATELHIKIAEYLDDGDLKNMRTVCSSLAAASLDLFADRFFRVRRHRFVPASLQALLETSASPVLARRIGAIEIETRRLDLLFARLPTTVFSDMQQQLCTIVKNLSKFGTLKRIEVTAGQRSTHHNVALNAVCKALVENECPIQTLGCDFWGPQVYPPGTLGKSPDEYPFDLPANYIAGFQGLLSSLRSLEITVQHYAHPPGNIMVSCYWLAQALASCTFVPELVFKGSNREGLEWAIEELCDLPLHTVVLKDIAMHNSNDLKSFLIGIKGSLRSLHLSNLGISGGTSTSADGWQVVLPWMGSNLTLDSVKLEELVHTTSNSSSRGPRELTSKPYSSESSSGPEQTRAHLLQIGNGEHDWEPREHHH